MTIQNAFIQLRNDLISWISLNLSLKANKTDITYNDIPFQFDNENNSYGYVKDGEFIKFGENINPKDLYNVAKGSGVLTEDMTFQQMCNALNKYYFDKLQQ